MIKTNKDKVIELILQCQPGQPMYEYPWMVDRNGSPFILPSIGGITLNVQVGDPAFGWEGDHIEPGVSCTADTHKPFKHPNNSLMRFACIGNHARVATGEAKGAEGVVIGKHGGSEHVLMHFSRDVKEKLTYDDKIIISARGMGLKFVNFPDIHIFNLDPNLLEIMKIIELGNGKIEVPVATLIPAACMGSGIGSLNAAEGDYDIMTGDPESVEKFKIDKLRLGDIVAILDHDNRFGRDYHQGAISIGVVMHSNCLLAGHGPGVDTLFTTATGLIEPIIDPKANLADILGIGTTLS